MYLILAIVFLALSLLFYWRGELSRKNTPQRSSSSDEDVISLDDDDIHHTDSSPLEYRYLAGWGVSTALAIIFLVAYFNSGGLSKSHRLKITYEELSAYMLGSRLSEHFKDSTRTGQIRTVIVVPDEESPYISSLIHQIKKGLGVGHFKIVDTISLAAGTVTAPLMTSADLYEVIDKSGNVDLIISLSGFVPTDTTQWQHQRRPFFAVYSDTAAFNDIVTLINLGLIDFAMISMGTFEAHSMIPQNEPLKAIFDENFIAVSTANVLQVAHDFRQTVTPIASIE